MVTLPDLFNAPDFPIPRGFTAYWLDGTGMRKAVALFEAEEGVFIEHDGLLGFSCLEFVWDAIGNKEPISRNLRNSSRV